MTHTIESLLEEAHDEAEAEGLPYAGALSPKEAYELLKLCPEAKLVDVRTQAERDWVGMVPNSLHVEWQSYPSMKPHSDFIGALEQLGIDASQPVLFLCRSGGRSHAAAALAAANGFSEAINILNGFEGDKTANHQRGLRNGWKFDQLPWIQS
jgi:rhodanese-related sulfurtransferase